MPESQAVRVSTPITVCTVSYHHAEHLRLNIELAAKLNAGADIRCNPTFVTWSAFRTPGIRTAPFG